jgi:hypothetical protein
MCADEVLAYHLIVGKGANELLDKLYKNIRAMTASGFTVNITQVLLRLCTHLPGCVLHVQVATGTRKLKQHREQNLWHVPATVFSC